LLAHLRRVVAVEPGESKSLLIATSYFFCLLASYYMLRPVRDALGVERGPDALKWLFLATLGATLVAMPLYTWMVGRLPRARLLPAVYHLAAATCVVFAALLWVLPAGLPRVRVGYVYFVWLSVYNVFGLTAVFWAFMADVHTPAQGKRLFGFIAAGGTLGAVVGSALASVVAAYGVEVVFLVAAAGIEVAVLLVHRLSRRCGGGRTATHASAPVSSLGDAFRGARQVVRSRYLGALALFMVFDILMSTYLYQAQGGIAVALLADASQRAQFFATVDLGANVLTLLLEVCIAAHVMRRFGLAPVLVLLPVASLFAVAALALAPTLLVVGIAQVVRRGVEFGLAKPGREVAFTVVQRQEKYEAKAFIDTVVNRATDVTVLWALALLTSTKPVHAVWVALPLVLIWIALTWWLAREFSRRSRDVRGQLPNSKRA
jgi:AAA family ATP:ADP antiporter